MLRIKELFTKILTSLSNKVDRTGDTMTGNLIVKSSATESKAFRSYTTQTRDTTPTSSTTSGGLRIYDISGADDKLIAFVDSYFGSNGREGLRLGTIRKPVGSSSSLVHCLYLNIDSAGNRTVEINDGAAWRNGLGMGNYNNTWISTSTIADIITANTTNATIDSAYYAQYGHAAMLYVTWKNKAAITISTAGVITDTVVGTIVSGKRPRATANAFGRESNGLTYSVTAAGVITLVSGNGGAAAKTIAANTVNNLYVCYMV